MKMAITFWILEALLLWSVVASAWKKWSHAGKNPGRVALPNLADGFTFAAIFATSCGVVSSTNFGDERHLTLRPGFGSLEERDVVTMNSSTEDKDRLFQVLALPGETFSVVDGRARVNGAIVSWIDGDWEFECPEQTVSTGEFAALRSSAETPDSCEDFGPFSGDAIVVHSWFRFWPLWGP